MGLSANWQLVYKTHMQSRYTDRTNHEVVFLVYLQVKDQTN